MKKLTVSARLEANLVQKLQHIAGEKYSGDRTQAIDYLLKLGLQSLEEGKDLAEDKYALPEQMLLAVEAEVQAQVEKRMDFFKMQIEQMIFKIQQLEKTISKKRKGSD